MKTYVLRYYEAGLLLITQGDIKSIEQEILSATVKLPRPMQNLDKKIIFWCLWWNSDQASFVELVVASGGCLSQIFNSQTLKSDFDLPKEVVSFG